MAVPHTWLPNLDFPMASYPDFVKFWAPDYPASALNPGSDVGRVFPASNAASQPFSHEGDFISRETFGEI